MKKRIRRSIYLLVSILFIFLVLTRGGYIYSLWSESDQQIEKKLTQWSDTVEIKYYDIGGKTIRYADIGKKEKPLLLLFHGAPGGISTRYKLLETTKLLETFRIIIVDRPGYGKSGAGKAVTSLEEQARLLAPLLKRNQHTTKPILVGHSLAPPILANMVLMYPKDIGGLVFVAGAVDPDHEIIWLASYPMNRKIFRGLVAPPLRVTNSEKLSHVQELSKLKNKWEYITHPLTVMHGNTDWIVPVENAYFIEQYATHAHLDMRIQAERDHFLPFERTQDVAQAIYDMYALISSPSTDVP